MIAFIDSDHHHFQDVLQCQAVYPFIPFGYLPEIASPQLGWRELCAIIEVGIRVAENTLGHANAIVVADHAISHQAFNTVQQRYAEYKLISMIDCMLCEVANGPWQKILVLADEHSAKINSFKTRLMQYNASLSVTQFLMHRQPNHEVLKQHMDFAMQETVDAVVVVSPWRLGEAEIRAVFKECAIVTPKEVLPLALLPYANHYDTNATGKLPVHFVDRNQVV